MNAPITHTVTPEPYKLPMTQRFSFASQLVVGRNAVAQDFLDCSLKAAKATYIIEGKKLGHMLAEMVEGDEDLLGQLINGAQSSTMGGLQMRAQTQPASQPPQPCKAIAAALKRGLGL